MFSCEICEARSVRTLFPEPPVRFRTLPNASLNAYELHERCQIRQIDLRVHETFMKLKLDFLVHYLNDIRDIVMNMCLCRHRSQYPHQNTPIVIVFNKICETGEDRFSHNFHGINLKISSIPTSKQSLTHNKNRRVPYFYVYQKLVSVLVQFVCLFIFYYK